mgnify:FL=1
MLISVSKTFLVTGEFTSDELDAHTDLLADCLLDLEDAVLLDSTVSASIEAHLVMIRITIEAESIEDGAMRADVAMRTAIHAAHGHTPKWSGPKTADVEFITQAQEAVLIPA